MSKDPHSDGQKDSASNGDYKPPHSPTWSAILDNKETHEEKMKENDQYRAGWENARKQR